MVSKKRVPGTVRAARLGLLERCSAQCNGRLDARRLRLSSPVESAAHAAGQQSVATPYIRRIQSQTDKSTSQIGARLLSDNTRLVEGLYLSAEAVVRELSATGRSASETQGRFAAALAQWRARVVERRFLAEAVVAHNNALVQYYWTTVARCRKRRRRVGGRDRSGIVEPVYPQFPASIELDRRWLYEDEFFLARGSSTNGHSGRATSIFLRALDILGGADPCVGRDEEGSK